MEYMTVAEVAKRWRVSKMTVYRMVRDKSLASIQIGRSFRIPVSEVVRVEGRTDGQLPQ